MSPETFITLRCLIAACRDRGVSNTEMEYILYSAGLPVTEIYSLLHRWQ